MHGRSQTLGAVRVPLSVDGRIAAPKVGLALGRTAARQPVHEHEGRRGHRSAEHPPADPSTSILATTIRDDGLGDAGSDLRSRPVYAAVGRDHPGELVLRVAHADIPRSVSDSISVSSTNAVKALRAARSRE